MILVLEPTRHAPQIVGLNNQVLLLFQTGTFGYLQTQHHAVLAVFQIQRRTGNIGAKLQVVGLLGRKFAFRGSRIHFKGQRLRCQRSLQ